MVTTVTTSSLKTIYNFMYKEKFHNDVNHCNYEFFKNKMQQLPL
jgi:hypothetical protein